MGLNDRQQRLATFVGDNTCTNDSATLDHAEHGRLVGQVVTLAVTFELAQATADVGLVHFDVTR